VLPCLVYASEPHPDADGWPNEPRTEIEERASGVPHEIGSVDPVQPNLWNDLNPATDLNTDVRTKRQTERPACQLMVESKRSEIGRYLTAGNWNGCALDRIFLNDARTSGHSDMNRSGLRGLNVEQSREDKIAVPVVCPEYCVVIASLASVLLSRANSAAARLSWTGQIIGR
jgi:hypothetical protein